MFVGRCCEKRGCCIYICDIEFVEAVWVAVVWFVGGITMRLAFFWGEEAGDEALWVVCDCALVIACPLGVLSGDLESCCAGEECLKS